MSEDKQTTAQGKSVIIVESPAKTRTLQSFLGKGYEILASMGHVRDLPEKGMGVDIEHDFEPTYEIIGQRKTVLTKLRSAIKQAKEIYLASDPDREGEAIAWHLAEALKLHNPRRLEFHEITRSAVEAALANPRTIDMHRVEAQQARRVLDRLVGYTLSPLLYKQSAGRARSAGRVQSVAVRLVVEREREILAFDAREYWTLEAWLSTDADSEPFMAKLVKRAGGKIELPSEADAQAAMEEIWNNPFVVSQIKLSDQFRNAPAPFITSTLQQDASVRMGFSPRRTMAVAQQLYEGLELGAEGHVGLITYMRTDSVKIADQARDQAKEFITNQYGSEYVPATARAHRSSKSAQEAHEAIRPTSVTRTPADMETYLDGDQLKLYTLIWNRFVASQMASVRLAQRAVMIASGEWGFEAKEIKIAFPGFSVVYPIRDKEALLPALAEGDELFLQGLAEEQHFTEPPARFTEASLVKELESNGIGRPSTYASILEIIQQRGYIYLDDKRKLRPTDLGFVVTDKLIEHFPNIVEVQFTANIEGQLDEIEEGKAAWKHVIHDFYDPFSAGFETAKQEMGPIRLPGLPTDQTCTECGKPMVQRTGRTGPFLACSGFPECKHTQPMPGAEPTEEHICEVCGKPMMVRRSRFGPFLGCSGYPECKNTIKLGRDGKPLQRRNADNGATNGDAAIENGTAGDAPQKEEPQVTDQTCEKCGKPMVVRRGRFGAFLGCSGYPKCRNIVRTTGEAAAAPAESATETPATGEAAPQQTCEKCGKPMVMKRGRYGAFLACSGYPECKNIAGREKKTAGGKKKKEEPAEVAE
jgi:DNA topoisomerase I